MTGENVPHNGTVDRTSSTLLVRIRAKDQEAWARFVRLYGPLVYAWCRRCGLQDDDAADVGQEVFKTVAGSIDGYRHDGEGRSMRGWLRSITQSRIVDFHRSRGRSPHALGGSDAQARWLDLPAAPDGSDGPGCGVEDEELILARRAMDMVLDDCKAQTRQAFLRVVIGGEDPGAVARDLGMSTNAVYLAKSHVLRKIREEYAGLVEV